VIIAVIETERVTLLAGEPELVMTPSESGRGQEIARCPSCRVAVLSHYPGAGRKAAFVRCGTLDAPAAVTPDVHIFTRSKLPWVRLPEGRRRMTHSMPIRARCGRQRRGRGGRC